MILYIKIKFHNNKNKKINIDILFFTIYLNFIT
jgi:hypothetical protein